MMAGIGPLGSQQAEYTRWRDGKSIISPNVEVAYFGEADDTVMRYRGVRANRHRRGRRAGGAACESCLVLLDEAELPSRLCTGELWAKLNERNMGGEVALNLLREVNGGRRASSTRRPTASKISICSACGRTRSCMLQYPPSRAAEMQRKEDDDAYALLQRHSPNTPVTKNNSRGV